jgi:hypothetical protein
MNPHDHDLQKEIEGNERMKDILSVCVPSGTVLAVVNIANLKDALSCVLIGTTIGYTVWKWRRDARKGKL